MQLQGKHSSRLEGAEQAKRRKKERRERHAKSLIVSGRVDTLWNAARLIQGDKFQCTKQLESTNL